MVQSGRQDNLRRQPPMVPRPPSPTKGGAFRFFRAKTSHTVTTSQPTPTSISGPNVSNVSVQPQLQSQTTAAAPYPRQQGLRHLNALPDFPQVYGSSSTLPPPDNHKVHLAVRRRSNSPSPSPSSMETMVASTSVGSITEHGKESGSLSGARANTLPSLLPSDTKEFEQTTATSFTATTPSQPWSPLVHMECLVGGRHLQLRADALLLSAELWPSSAAGRLQVSSFAACTATLLSALEYLAEFVLKLERMLTASVRPKPQDLTECIRGVSSRTTALIELSHEAVVALCPTPNEPAMISRTELLAAADLVDVALFRITQHLEDLREEEYMEESGEFILWSCGQLSTALTGLVVHCRPGATCPPQEATLIRLCVAAVQATSQTLLAGLSAWLRTVVGPEGLVARGSARRRVQAMGQAVQASVRALVNLALEREFVGDPVCLPASVKSVRCSICGSCLTLSSACIQLLTSVNRLYRSENVSSQHASVLQRFSACLQAVNEASAHFRQALTIMQGAI